MTRPLLSICIATVNRAEFLAVMLESIVSQATDDIEIVIVDGASTDNTGQVVEGYQKRFAGIRYFRLSMKGGVDQDYNRAVELAEGDYCWLMSDDDQLKPGALQCVLSSMRGGFGVIIVNGETVTFDLTRVLVPRHLPLETDSTFFPADQERFFALGANYLTFIGCVVIRRTLWLAREREKYFGTVFVHVGVVFQAPIAEGIHVIAEPLILIRHGNTSWLGAHFEIWNFKWPDIIWSFPYSDQAKAQVTLREPWRNKKGLLTSRAKGAYSLDNYERLLEPQLNSRSERFLSRFIALTPGWLANLIVFVYFSIFRRRDLQATADLQTSRFYFLKWMRARAPHVLARGSR